MWLMGHSIISCPCIVKKNTCVYFFAGKVHTPKSQNLVVFYTKVGCIFSRIFGSFLFLLKSSHLIHSFDLCLFFVAWIKKQKTSFFHSFIQFPQRTPLINFFREIKKGENTLPLCIQIVLLCFNICFVHAFVGL